MYPTLEVSDSWTAGRVEKQLLFCPLLLFIVLRQYILSTKILHFQTPNSDGFKQTTPRFNQKLSDTPTTATPKAIAGRRLI